MGPCTVDLNVTPALDSKLRIN